VRNKLGADVADILATADVKNKFTNLGMELAPQSGAEFDRLVVKEVERWSKVIKQAGIAPN
jgi:tripartite-type tricarboxylate transporter receptor subunit TctC